MALVLLVLLAAACGEKPIRIDPPGFEGEGEGEGEGEPVDNDTCAAPIALSDGVLIHASAFGATATRYNCSSTNAAGDDGIDDVAFSFVLASTSDVTITANSDIFSDAGIFASRTLTLFDTPLCAFPTPHTFDDRTCVGDGLTFDAPTVLSVAALPAGTWFVVAETFGDLSPFSIRIDVTP